MYVCMYVCVCVFMYVCMYVYSLEEWRRFRKTAGDTGDPARDTRHSTPFTLPRAAERTHSMHEEHVLYTHTQYALLRAAGAVPWLPEGEGGAGKGRGGGSQLLDTVFVMAVKRRPGESVRRIQRFVSCAQSR
jgi:hypothetical protein